MTEGDPVGRLDPDADTYRLQPADSRLLRLLQLTDCHIFADAEACLYGLNTRDSLARVCDHILQNNPGFDALMATGDLSQDASTASYRYLAEAFSQLPMPGFCIPGNHDDPEAMRHNLKTQNMHHQKILLAPGWVVILLDSTIAGEVSGELSTQQLGFLDQALGRFADRHALIFLHHQAMAVGSEWIDAKGLKNPASLLKLLAGQDNVRAVVCGHVHQQSEQVIDGVSWMSTPSSCVQFKPEAREFTIDELAPGYRWLTLYADGRIESGIERVY